MDVAVNYVIAALPQDTAETAGEQKGITPQTTGDDFASEGFDFAVKESRLAAGSAEVHLKFLPVDVAQYVHQPGFDPGWIHSAQNV